MKFFSLLVSIIIFASIFVNAQNECRASVLLISDKDNTEYFIEGRTLGQGRQVTTETDTGWIKITARENGNIWNPFTISDSLYISGCTHYVKEFIFSGDELNSSEMKSRINLPYSEPVNNKRFYEKTLFRYLIGSLLVFGGTTAYFKLKADDKFNHYEITGDETLLSQTRRYDLISGITFGALQINLGLLLYYFLSE